VTKGKVKGGVERKGVPPDKTIQKCAPCTRIVSGGNKKTALLQPIRAGIDMSIKRTAVMTEENLSGNVHERGVGAARRKRGSAGSPIKQLTQPPHPLPTKTTLSPPTPEKKKKPGLETPRTPPTNTNSTQHLPGPNPLSRNPRKGRPTANTRRDGRAQVPHRPREATWGKTSLRESSRCVGVLKRLWAS